MYGLKYYLIQIIYRHSSNLSYSIVICLDTVIWFQVFLPNINNLQSIIKFQLNNNNNNNDKQ